MKRLSLSLLSVILLFISCVKDKQEPIITSMSFVSDKTPPEVDRGDTLIFSFTAEDNKDLDRYTIEIVPIGNFSDWSTSELYYFENSVKSSVGISKKELFIPTTIDTGSFEFTLIIEDKSNNRVERMQEIRILGDTILPPTIVYTDAPIQFTEFVSNDIIELSGTINGTLQISNLQVFLVETNDNLDNDEVSSNNSIVLLSSIGINAFAPYEFESSINVGAPKDNNSPPNIIGSWNLGDCYLLVKVYSNGMTSYGDRINIIVNE